MLIKTATATGQILNFMVAKTTGMCVLNSNGTVFWGNFATVTPTTNWAQGGPLIEREKIESYWHIALECWSAKCNDHLRYGPTPLIAAMRCFVASKLGDEVDVPDELT